MGLRGLFYCELYKSFSSLAFNPAALLCITRRHFRHAYRAFARQCPATSHENRVSTDFAKTLASKSFTFSIPRISPL